MKTTFDMRKVAYAQFCYINQEGSIRLSYPILPTVHGDIIQPTTFAKPHPDYPFETIYQRALRLDIIDVWRPYLRLEFNKSQVLEYTDSKALELWKAWNAYIFGKVNKQQKKGKHNDN